jgi:hypothetical protein
MWKLKWKEIKEYDSNMVYRSTGQMVLDTKKIKVVFERSPDADLSSLKTEMEKVEEVPEGPVSEYVGGVGERFEGVLSVLSTFDSEGYYGTTRIVKMKDEGGNVFVWFASSLPDVNSGDKVLIKGRVKKHEEYRGVKQTTLTNCRSVVLES